MLVDQKRLLVVDDESVIAEFMARVLSKQGYAVDVATNGELAKGLLELNSYELIIVDIRMPKMNGIQLYEYIKATWSSLANRVVFTSGELVDTQTLNYLAAEHRLFLHKPFGSEALKNAVDKTLQAIE